MLSVIVIHPAPELPEFDRKLSETLFSSCFMNCRKETRSISDPLNMKVGNGDDPEILEYV